MYQSAASAALEQGNGLDVSGMRKHVHYTGSAQYKPVITDQRACVAREGTGMAGNIHDAPHIISGQILKHGRGATAWRIEQQQVDRIPAPTL